VPLSIEVLFGPLRAFALGGDLALVKALQRSKAVLGPAPAAFAPEVTSDELRQEITNSMLGWEKLFTPDSPYNNRFHQVFFVLNNCRAE
jgi:hypothetical protein